ncbi:hypothetical protein [Acidisphaera sp. L21]|jgi:hypothetical protein|uniref:2-amino-5-chloromuconate deaminase CnbZ n=1 Tax=Acidisphaera sp. L21 TaxID=1641851 RepID=UPI00131C5DF7|nr:hypothetical protein [Acidisphaera sp. L21]
MSGAVERTGYRYIPGPFQFSSGVAALPGYAIHRVRFAKPVLLKQGFDRIEAFLTQQGLPLTAFCACELRSPAPFTDAGFIAFNRDYVGTLTRWGIVEGDNNPVARSNVCPELNKPEGPSFHAFSIAVPSPDAPPSFVIAGSAEAHEGPGAYRDKTVRWGETSVDAIAEKIGFVLGQVEKRMASLDVDWTMVTGAQAYTVYDIYPTLARDIVARGAAEHGVTWHFCRPPVIGLEFELDCRGVHAERVLL